MTELQTKIKVMKLISGFTACLWMIAMGGLVAYFNVDIRPWAFSWMIFWGILLPACDTQR